MDVHFYKNPKAAESHDETVEKADWLDGFATAEKSEVVFKRTSDGKEITIPFADFISATQSKPKYWRFTYCGGTGGLVIANTKTEAVQKLKEKYGAGAASAEVWEWEKDDYFDSKHPDVFNIYDN